MNNCYLPDLQPIDHRVLDIVRIIRPSGARQLETGNSEWWVQHPSVVAPCETQDRTHPSSECDTVQCGLTEGTTEGGVRSNNTTIQ